MAMQWKCKKRLEEWPSLSDVWKVAGVYLVTVTIVGVRLPAGENTISE